MTSRYHMRGTIRRWSPAAVARHGLLAAVLAMAALLAVAGQAAAKRWSPGETIGNISGAQKWCGMPWEANAGCPAPASDKRFNLDVFPLFPDPRNTCPTCKGAMAINQPVIFNEQQELRTIGCGQVVVIINPIFFNTIYDIKEVGPGNEAPAAARGADVSFRCTGFLGDLDTPPYVKLGIPLKWWVNIKTPKSDTERGWVYIEAKDGTFSGFKVPVTRGRYSHDIDVCTPNSDRDTCRALAS